MFPYVYISIGISRSSIFYKIQLLYFLFVYILLFLYIFASMFYHDFIIGRLVGRKREREGEEALSFVFFVPSIYISIVTLICYAVAFPSIGVFPKWFLVTLGSSIMLMLPLLDRVILVGTLLTGPSFIDTVAVPL